MTELRDRTAAPHRDAPYKGLERYDIGDAELFYGRADACAVVDANLRASHITVMYGASGVGKSSLLRAGVAASLEAERRSSATSQRNTYYALTVFDGWRDDPIPGLRSAISDTVRAVAPGSVLTEPSDASLVEVVEEAMAALGERRLLVVLDQFEEYFVYHAAEKGPETFAAQFPGVVARSDLRVNFLISIREDALAQLDDFEPHIPNLLRNRLRIRALSAEEARDAIRRPLSWFGAEIEPELVEEVLKVSQGQMDAATGHREAERATDGEVATPYLQLVLEALWAEEQLRHSRVLRLDTYNQLGGAEAIVRAHVISAIGHLSGSQQAVAARILHYLVTPTGTKMAQTVPDLAYLAQCRNEEVASILNILAHKDLRIVRAVTNGRPGAPQRFELFHDVLARPILAWRTSYVAAEEVARFRRRRRRFLIVGSAALATVAAIVGGVLYAIKNQQVADQARRSAKSSDLAIAALATAAVNPAGAVRTALDALDTAKTPVAEEALREIAPQYLRLRTVIPAAPHTHWAVIVGDSDVVAYTGSEVDVWKVASGRLIRSFRGLETAAVSPSSGALVTIQRGQLQVHNLLTDASGPVWPAAGATHVTVSGDARAIFTWGQSGVVRDGRGAPTATVPAARDVRAAGLSKSGQTLAVVSADGDVSVFERSPAGEYVLHEPILADGPPWLDATPSPDGRDVLLRSRSTVSLFRLKSGKTIRLTLQGSGRIDAAAFDAVGSSVVTAAENGDTRAYDVSNGGTLVATYIGISGSVKGAVFSNDGVLVAAAGNDGAVRIWNRRTSAPYLTLTSGPVPTLSVAFSADDSEVLATTAGDYDVWSVNPRRKITSEKQLADAAASRGGRLVALASTKRGLALWRPRQQGEVVRLDRRTTHSASFDAAGSLVAARVESNQVTVWHTTSPYGRVETRTFGSAVSQVRLRPTGGDVLVGTQTGAYIWHRHGTPRTTILERGGQMVATVSVAYSADGRTVALGHHGTIDLMPAGGGKVTQLSFGRSAINSVAFDRTGTYLVAGGEDHEVGVWDLHDPAKPLATLPIPAIATSVRFNPAGSLVGIAGTDGIVRVWNWRADNVLVAEQTHAGPARAVAFIPGREITLLSAGDDGIASIWPCATCASLPKLEELARAYRPATPG